jgi:HAD superfamily hydrolase (TIGR01549 family)
MDGTLRSVSWSGLLVSYEEIIKTKGKNPEDFFTDEESFRSWFDGDWHKNIKKIDGVFVENPIINQIFHTHYDPHVKLFPWVEEVLEHLSKRYRLAILSSSSTLSVERELGELVKFFDIIVGAESVSRLKPDPEGVLHILKCFDLTPENVIIVGDTPQDYHAGVSAGVGVFLVTWGLSDYAEFVNFRYDGLFFLENPREFLDL